ncbi:flavodoxin [Leptolyngbya sp. Heron Island J]|uniref:flavodoxin n=1 Tax=Leptolyngbya sp. Heron Island J TaxID=1385935 RepID=UPI0003B97299|nr:flavodoxin [Leptolyngbya sp. Heron Island J]ESA32421.1 flavodoxin [Leptolyngbya sp. Heron Island J]
MSKIGIFYGSTSGTTEEIAEKICEFIGEDNCDLYNMEEDFDDVDDLLKYDYLLLGCSTWGAGEVQNDWREPLFDFEVDKPDFSGKTIALFGPGDCEGHSKHFVGALGTIYDQFKALGAKLVGAVSTEDYSFEKSSSIRDGKFVGLPLDEVNESDKTDQRIADWLELLKADFPVLAA